jgi:hypothetical protein
MSLYISKANIWLATKNNEKLYILLFINSFLPLPHLPFIASLSPYSSFGRSLAPQSTHPRVFVLFAIYRLSASGGPPFLSCWLYSFFVSAVSPPFLSFFSPLGSWAMMREAMFTCQQILSSMQYHRSRHSLQYLLFRTLSCLAGLEILVRLLVGHDDDMILLVAGSFWWTLDLDLCEDPIVPSYLTDGSCFLTTPVRWRSILVVPVRSRQRLRRIRYIEKRKFGDSRD